MIQMSRHKRLVLTFDAFGTLFTPREPIGKQYVRTLPNVPLLLGTTGLFPLPLCSLDFSECLKLCDEEGNADFEVLIRPMLPENMGWLVLLTIR